LVGNFHKTGIFLEFWFTSVTLTCVYRLLVLFFFIFIVQQRMLNRSLFGITRNLISLWNNISGLFIKKRKVGIAFSVLLQFVNAC